MKIEYSKIIELIEERKAACPEAAAAFSALIMDLNAVLAVENAAADGPTPEALMQLWNEMRNPALPECRRLTDRRRKAARARLREFPLFQDWTRFIAYVNESEFMLGNNNSGWKANFDWLVKPETMLKFIEKRFPSGPPSREKDPRRELDSRE